MSGFVWNARLIVHDVIVDGQSLPLRCHPSSSSSPSKPVLERSSALARTPHQQCAKGRRKQETIRKLVEMADENVDYRPSHPSE